MIRLDPIFILVHFLLIKKDLEAKRHLCILLVRREFQMGRPWKKMLALDEQPVKPTFHLFKLVKI